MRVSIVGESCYSCPASYVVWATRYCLTLRDEPPSTPGHPKMETEVTVLDREERTRTRGRTPEAETLGKNQVSKFPRGTEGRGDQQPDTHCGMGGHAEGAVQGASGARGASQGGSGPEGKRWEVNRDGPSRDSLCPIRPLPPPGPRGPRSRESLTQIGRRNRDRSAPRRLHDQHRPRAAAAIPPHPAR